MNPRYSACARRVCLQIFIGMTYRSRGELSDSRRVFASRGRAPGNLGGEAGRLRDVSGAPDLETRQACAMKSPTCICGTGNFFPHLVKFGFNVESEMTQAAKVQEPSM